MATQQTKILGVRKKRTLILSGDVFQRLGVEADRLGMRRSAVADQILGTYLRHITVHFGSRASVPQRSKRDGAKESSLARGRSAA